MTGKCRTAVLFAFVVLLSWVAGGTPSALAHDPNLARWDISAKGRTVSIAVRTSGAGLFSELRAQDPDADWDGMSSEAYRARIDAFLEQAVDFRADGRRLPVKVEAVNLGHEVTATVRLRRRRLSPLEAFTFDLSEVSSRRNQHHLVFVKHDAGHERFMLHRSNETGLVLRWNATGEPTK